MTKWMVLAVIVIGALWGFIVNDGIDMIESTFNHGNQEVTQR